MSKDGKDDMLAATGKCRALTHHVGQIARAAGISRRDVVHEVGAHLGRVKCVALSAGGRWLVTGGPDKVARLWDLPTNQCAQCVMTFEGHAHTVWAVCLSSALLNWEGACKCLGTAIGLSERPSTVVGATPYRKSRPIGSEATMVPHLKAPMERETSRRRS